MDNVVPINRYKGTHLQDILTKPLEVTLPDVYSQILNIIEDKGFLAGGCIRVLLLDKWTPTTDFDVYVYKEEDRQFVYDKFLLQGFVLKKDLPNCWWLEKEEGFLLWKHKVTVQIIKTFVGTPQQIVDEFDFTVCRIATDGITLWYDKDFEEHNKKKLLVIKTIQCPIGSIRRIIKYSKKGFWISNFSICKLYEHYITLGDEFRAKLFDLLMKLDVSSDHKLEQKEFDELEAILVKFD